MSVAQSHPARGRPHNKKRTQHSERYAELSSDHQNQVNYLRELKPELSDEQAIDLLERTGFDAGEAANQVIEGRNPSAEWETVQSKRKKKEEKQPPSAGRGRSQNGVPPDAAARGRGTSSKGVRKPARTKDDQNVKPNGNTRAASSGARLNSQPKAPASDNESEQKDTRKQPKGRVPQPVNPVVQPAQPNKPSWATMVKNSVPSRPPLMSGAAAEALLPTQSFTQQESFQTAAQPVVTEAQPAPVESIQPQVESPVAEVDAPQEHEQQQVPTLSPSPAMETSVSVLGHSPSLGVSAGDSALAHVQPQPPRQQPIGPGSRSSRTASSGMVWQPKKSSLSGDGSVDASSTPLALSVVTQPTQTQDSIPVSQAPPQSSSPRVSSPANQTVRPRSPFTAPVAQPESASSLSSANLISADDVIIPIPANFRTDGGKKLLFGSFSKPEPSFGAARNDNVAVGPNAARFGVHQQHQTQPQTQQPQPQQPQSQPSPRAQPQQLAQPQQTQSLPSPRSQLQAVPQQPSPSQQQPSQPQLQQLQMQQPQQPQLPSPSQQQLQQLPHHMTQPSPSAQQSQQSIPLQHMQPMQPQAQPRQQSPPPMNMNDQQLGKPMPHLSHPSQSSAGVQTEHQGMMQQPPMYDGYGAPNAMPQHYDPMLMPEAPNPYSNPYAAQMMPPYMANPPMPYDALDQRMGPQGSAYRPDHRNKVRRNNSNPSVANPMNTNVPANPNAPGASAFRPPSKGPKVDGSPDNGNKFANNGVQANVQAKAAPKPGRGNGPANVQPNNSAPPASYANANKFNGAKQQPFNKATKYNQSGFKKAGTFSPQQQPAAFSQPQPAPFMPAYNAPGYYPPPAYMPQYYQPPAQYGAPPGFNRGGYPYGAPAPAYGNFPNAYAGHGSPTFDDYQGADFSKAGYMDAQGMPQPQGYPPYDHWSAPHAGQPEDQVPHSANTSSASGSNQGRATTSSPAADASTASSMNAPMDDRLNPNMRFSSYAHQGAQFSNPANSSINSQHQAPVGPAFGSFMNNPPAFQGQPQAMPPYQPSYDGSYGQQQWS